MTDYDPQKQFELSREEFLAKLDFLNWDRYFAITKELTLLQPKSILEIGPGEGTLKRLFAPFVERYATMDVNPKLEPDVLGDIRSQQAGLDGKFDVVIAADILEHIPFPEVEAALRNIHTYLAPSGHALITIPHRAWFVLGLSWLWNYRRCVLRAPDWIRTAYHRIVRWRKPPIDPDHQWEIGDGEHSIKDVEGKMRTVGFAIEKRNKLLYVDFWVLKK